MQIDNREMSPSSPPVVMADLMRAFYAIVKIWISVMEANGPYISNYRVVISNGELRSVVGSVQKAGADKATLNCKSIRRYILSQGIFDILRNQRSVSVGKIQMAKKVHI